MDGVYSYSVLEREQQLALRVRPDREDHVLEVRTDRDEVGVLFRLCAVLYAHGCRIRHASIGKDGPGIRDEFRIAPGSALTEVKVQAILEDLRALLFEGLSVLAYLGGRTHLPVSHSGGGDVEITGASGDATIEVVTTDQPGLLLSLAQAFYLMDIDIEGAAVTPEPDGRVRNTFRIGGDDARFENAEFRRRLREELTGLL